MKIADAIKLRDEYIKILVGRPYDGSRPDLSIKDIIISDSENARNVYTKMYEEHMSNEMALSFFPIEEDNYDALIIAHQWPWGNGDILIEKVLSYIKENSN